MEISKETLRHATALGLIACRWPALRDLALGIFHGVKIALPDSSSWLIGMAMVYANCDDDPKAACQFMEDEGISEQSGDLMARAFKGLFLILAKRIDEAEKILQAVVGDGSDPEASRLAQSALDNEINRA